MRRFSLMIVLAGLLVAVPSPSQTRVAVLPVAISAPGSFGSVWKTEIQVYNPNPSTLTFRLVFHVARVSGKSTDPHLDFSILPLSTVHVPDLLPAMGQSGIGSVDVLALSDPNNSVAGVIRVFNDAGAAGTSGFTESSEGFLEQNNSGILICPADPSLQRFNVGVRTMEQGATVQVTVRDGSGHTISQFTRSYDPTYFDQTDVAAFLGGAATPGNSSITVHVLAGSLYLYGVSADNRTNDPSFQPASN
jgi:hypothetical protein